MSGIAIIIPGADFSNRNLGKVTVLQDIPITGISINSQASYTGLSVQLSVAITPSNSNQTQCRWVIESGSEYASIDNSGKLTILEGANNTQVTVRAISIYNQDISSTATFTVTYKSVIDQLDALSSITYKAIELNAYELTVGYVPENTAYREVSWSIVSGSEYAELDGSILRVKDTATTLKPVTVRATSNYNPSLTSEITINVQWKEAPSWNLTKVFGAIDGVASGLYEQMAANKHSLLIEFTDDSYMDFDSSNQAIFTTGVIGANNPAMYKEYNLGMYSLFHHGVVLNTCSLYNSGWTPSESQTQLSKVLKAGRMIDATTKVNYIGGKSFLSTYGSVYVDDEDKGVSINSSLSGGACGYLTFGWAAKQAAASGLQTLEAIYSALGEGYLSAHYSTVKIKTFIIIPGTYGTAQEVISNRASAYVDIQFDADGNPYNAGSHGDLMTANYIDL